jgi:hypothetical protein
MLKKRAEVSQVPRSGRLMCSRLDIGSEALPNDRCCSRHRFGKGSCHAGMGSKQRSKLVLRPGIQLDREARRLEKIESCKTPLREEL